MRKFVWIALTVIFSSTLFAQNRCYQGKVIDAVYRTPVAYAAVYIQSTSYGSVTDNVGEFSFTAPDSLPHVQLVVARQDFKISYLAVDPQNKADLLIAIRPDDFETSTQVLIDSLKGGKNKLGTLVDKATRFVINDWIPLGNPEVNKFDFGRIQTFPTYNPIEGVRLREALLQMRD
ncbi:MAG: carboxypeptidase-like regulatory domain-containing protein [Proteiniphilum sp.]|nr:carboxypeptidase-like regulatory domain-containing protein [Proteiniphilum sp.]